MTGEKYPEELDKKMKLLTYFKRYMTEHLVTAGGNLSRDIGDVVSRIPHLHTWFRTNCAVVMHLTNGSVQVSINWISHFARNAIPIVFKSHFSNKSHSNQFHSKFAFQLNFSDHIKIILCPRMSAVTYIDTKLSTYKFSTISKLGCSNELYQKLRYAHEKLKKLLEKLK